MNQTLFGSGIKMVWFSNGWFYSYKMVRTGFEFKWPFNFWSGFQMVTIRCHPKMVGYWDIRCQLK
jgi:hypothetical protein